MELLTLIKLTIIIGWIAAAYIFYVADKESNKHQNEERQ